MRVEARNLVKHFGVGAGRVFALNDVSIAIDPGEMVVLLGPSGCGKTTLLRSIAGLVEPQGGEIFLGDRRVYSAADKIWTPPERRGVSMVFQSYALWPHMTLFENIAYPLECQKMGSAAITARVTQVMKMVGLDPYAQRYPSQLSGGQQQRAALGRAIASNSGVILFDEPLSNVDAKVRDQIRREIVDLQEQLGFAALYVTHDQVEAGALADTLVVMDHGRIAQSGTPAEIYDHPATRYVAGFIGAANELPARIVERAAGATMVETGLGRMVGDLRPTAKTDAEATVLFRPEACQLSAREPSGPNKWPCVVRRTTFLAAMAEITLTIGAGEHAVDVTALAAKGQYAEGMQLWLRLPQDAVWIFAE